MHPPKRPLRAGRRRGTAGRVGSSSQLGLGKELPLVATRLARGRSAAAAAAAGRRRSHTRSVRAARSPAVGAAHPHRARLLWTFQPQQPGAVRSLAATPLPRRPRPRALASILRRRRPAHQSCGLQSGGICRSISSLHALAPSTEDEQVLRPTLVSCGRSASRAPCRRRRAAPRPSSPCQSSAGTQLGRRHRVHVRCRRVRRCHVRLVSAELLVPVHPPKTTMCRPITEAVCAYMPG